MERYNFVQEIEENVHSSPRRCFERPDVLRKIAQEGETHFMPNNTPFKRQRVSCLADDFYTNLISWSKNCIVYGVDGKIFAFDLHTSKAKLLHAFENKVISSVNFNLDGTKIAIGCNAGVVDLLDINTLKTQQYWVHKSRVGVVEWNGDSFFTGSRDRQIKLVDPRSAMTEIWLSNHQQEVCGLKINCCKNLLASGGNDNLMIVYDSRVQKYPMYVIRNHRAAVKALSWSPIHPYSVLSGGGTADKTIKMWDVSGRAPIVQKSLDTQSQVCNLHWMLTNHIISTHGYSQNDSRIFSESLLPKFVNRGHKNRVIHFAVSTDEQYYITGSSDSDLNIWKAGECTEGLKFR